MKPAEERNYACFTHKACEYFPCHAGADPAHFNCLFCYCPLYVLGTDCGGNYHMLSNGVKDCSDCLFPHIPKSYDLILSRYPQLINAMKMLQAQKNDPE